MFFGNMQSFYRRNPIHNQSPSRGSQPKPKEHVRHVRNKHKGENPNDDDNSREAPIRRKSFSISRNEESEELGEDMNPRVSVPVIKIGLYEPESSKKTFNILKEKEKALWYNNCTESDNSERLGPNRNNIIEETLEIERQQKDEWSH